MGIAIFEGLEEKGMKATLCCLKDTHRAHIMEKLLTSSTLVLGSPTINNGVIPSMAAFLQYITGLKPRNKIGAAFGSHGWGGESVRQICDTFDKLKFNRLDDGLRIVFVPDENQLQECREYGHKIAEVMGAKEAEAVTA